MTSNRSDARNEVKSTITAMDFAARGTGTNWRKPAQTKTIAGHVVTIGYRNVVKKVTSSNSPVSQVLFCKLDGKRIAYAKLVVTLLEAADAIAKAQDEAAKVEAAQDEAARQFAAAIEASAAIEAQRDAQSSAAQAQAAMDFLGEIEASPAEVEALLERAKAAKTAKVAKALTRVKTEKIADAPASSSSSSRPEYMGEVILPPVWKLQMIRDTNLPSAVERLQVCSPADIAAPLMQHIGDEAQEHFVVCLLDTKNGVIGLNTVYIGSVNAAIIRIAEVFRPAILLNASALIIAHNHPSGDPTPSPEDVRVTEQIIEAGKLLDIPLLDHVVVGNNKYVSLKERGLAFGRK